MRACLLTADDYEGENIDQKITNQAKETRKTCNRQLNRQKAPQEKQPELKRYITSSFIQKLQDEGTEKCPTT